MHLRGDEHVTMQRPTSFEGVELVRVSNTSRPWTGIADDFVVTIAVNPERDRCHSYYRKQKFERALLRVLSPGEAYRLVPQGPCDWLTLRLDRTAFDAWTPTPPGARRSLFAHTCDDREVYDAFRRVHHAFATDAEEATCGAHLRRALKLLVEHDARQEQASTYAPRSVRTARALIRDRLTEDLRLSELADAAGLSREHLLRSFHKELGMPPHQYLMHARVARARALLAGGMPATQVAHEAGFCDQSHLNRWFKRVLGVTPGQYVRAAVPPPMRSVA